MAAAEAARPDFLVVDGSSGQPADLQLCRAIRRVVPQSYTYSLLLSEQPEVGDITAALEAGFDDFLAAADRVRRALGPAAAGAVYRIRTAAGRAVGDGLRSRGWPIKRR